MTAAVTRGLPCGNKAPILKVGDRAASLALVSILDSFAYDFQARVRLGGLSLNYFIVSETALPLRFRSRSVEPIALSLSFGSSDFAATWMRSSFEQEHSWRAMWAVTPAERLRLRCQLDALVAALFGMKPDEFGFVLAECDHPEGSYRDSLVATLSPKGFWRVGKGLVPELRPTVLSQIAFHDLTEKIRASGGDCEKGIDAFLHQNNGEGWQLPEKLCLADYGLGHDDRAKKPQPVASLLGPRFYDWQLEQDVDESWRECELHARNLLGEDGYQQLLAEIEAERRGESPQPRMVAEGKPKPLNHGGEHQGKLF